MNLEDKIRSSARRQSTRYEAADDLFPRIEHRRRQRAARRMTASAVAAVVLFGGGALALTTLRDRDTDPGVANSTELTVEDTMPPVTTTATTLGPSTTAPSAATVSTTTIAPDDTSSAVNELPVNTTPTDADVPSPSILADGSTGIPEFWMVPQFGSEPVRGSGCGSTGGLGDMIPDGLWAGFIVDDGSDGSVGIDLLCVFTPEGASVALANPTATTITADPNYLIVNNSTRARFMPMDGNVVLRLAERDADGRCMDARTTTQWADIPADRQAWIRIHGGVITWILADCPPQ
jgi:hypothetical protein